MLRQLKPELLDSLPVDHPDARHSRRDLILVNRLMGNAGWFRASLAAHLRPSERVLELGAGMGELAQGLRASAPGGGHIYSALHSVFDAVLLAALNSAASSSFTAKRLLLWVTGMSKRLPGLVIEVENLPDFLAKSDEDILQHVRSVLLLRAYAVQRAQLAKCDGVQFSPTKDSCIFSAKGRALLHVRFAQLKA